MSKRRYRPEEIIARLRNEKVESQRFPLDILFKRICCSEQ